MALTARQLDAIEALLVERSIEAAAKAAGVAPRSLVRWREMSEFQAAYRAAQDRYLRQAAGMLARRSIDAVARLVDEMGDADPSPARIAAADKLLSHAAKLNDALDARDELLALKAQIEEMKRAAGGGGETTEA